MKIRTQLVLAWLILSILPLTAIVLYSYYSSRNAVEDAYRSEAQRLATQMDRRLTGIRSDLDQRLATLSALPLPTPLEESNASFRGIAVDSILMAMGEAAPLVDALEYVPARPRVAPVPSPAPSAATPAAVAPPPVPEAPAVPAPRVAAAAEVPDRNGNVKFEYQYEFESGKAFKEPVVVDLPAAAMPVFKMPPDFGKRIAAITELSVKLTKEGLSPEEREQVKIELREKQRVLAESLKVSREQFSKAMIIVNQQREERTMARVERQQERRAGLPLRQTRIDPSALAPGEPKPAPTAKAQVRPRRELSEKEKERLQAKEKQASLLFGHKFLVPVHKEGEVVGQIRAQLSTEEVVKRVLGAPLGDASEIPFAIDRAGNVYTRNATERATLDRLGIPRRVKKGQPIGKIEGWIVAVSSHKESGLRVGVARPVGENLEELRQTAARNFGFGLGLIAFALVGIVPLANHLTRDVKMVAAGAERIAGGDLTTRLPVHSRNEFGQLAGAFNRMAEDLSKHREQEIHQRVLALEYERKSVELEEARRFQLSMLPKTMPKHERYGIGAFTQTAAEVGGDYYDFHVSPSGALSVTIGDATGHGAKAGTMVTVIKTLFAGYDGSEPPSQFLRDAAEKIKRMDLGRMAMALSLARFEGTTLTIASAGMPPLLVHRRTTAAVEEVTLPATPLGTLGVHYKETSIELASGDTVLLMSDGFPELQNGAGQQLGYTAAMQEFAGAAAAPSAGGVIDALAGASKRWHGDQPPNDDITFVVVRVT
jgi:serine phosphatase RsbU (regulator of sigma subunit)